MTTDLDDQLRTRLHDLVPRPGVSADDLYHDVRRRIGRRRRHRLGGAAVGLTLLVIGVAVGVRSRDDPSPDVVASDEQVQAVVAPPAPLAIELVEATGAPTGTAAVSIVFDGPLPDGAPTYVEDIEKPDAPGIAFTTQGPSGLKVCADTHWFPGEMGTVDILIPASWLVPSPVDPQPPIRPLGDHPPSKVPMCGPYNGYVQFAIWGPVSDEVEDISVRLADDRTRLVLEIQPE